jgi:dTMP kinase
LLRDAKISKFVHATVHGIEESGMLITFEGLDGSGKSTQARLLVDRLAGEDGFPVVHFIREPGGTEISERIRAILLDRGHSDLDAVTELFLFSASRAQLTNQVIRPALDRAEVVVCDRYDDSTTAYQGFGRQMDLKAIAGINRLATGGIRPAVTFFLDVPLAEIARRRDAARKGTDRMEESGEEFYGRVLDGYRQIAAGQKDRYVVLDGTKPVPEVHGRIWEEVRKRIVRTTS